MSNKELQSVCNSLKELEDYLEQKALHHNCYKTYIYQERYESLRKQEAIFLSNGRNWNDIDDAMRLNGQKSKKLNFAICFSFSKSESVAMWMLYGGMNNTGVMIDFTRRQIQQLIDLEQISLGYWQEGNYVEIKKLYHGEFDLCLTDVLYYSDPLEVIKRSDARCEMSDERIINGLSWRCKAYPWNYENECRLVISIDRNRVQDARIDTVKLNIDDMLINLEKMGRVYQAPNNTTSRFQSSKLKGRINWNLCGRTCKKRKIRYRKKIENE